MNSGADRIAGTAVIECALKLGITHFDTAPGYGFGLSESLLGQVVGDDRSCTITTKLGSSRPSHPWLRSALRRVARPIIGKSEKLKSNLSQFANTKEVIERHLTRDFLERSLALSLKSLRRSCVDIALLHEFELRELENQEILDAFSYFIRDGWTKSFGVSSGNIAPTHATPGTIGQFRWQYEEPPYERAGYRFRHGVLRYIFPEARKRIADPTVVATAAALGFPLESNAELASFVISLALALDPDSILIISTNDAFRLRETVERIRWLDPIGQNYEIESASNALLR